MTCHRVIGDGWIWEGISLMDAWISAVPVEQWSIIVCLKEKVEWRNNISLKKGEGCVIIQGKGLIKIIVKFKAEKISCTFVSCTRPLFKGHKIINVHKDNFVRKTILSKLLWGRGCWA